MKFKESKYYKPRQILRYDDGLIALSGDEREHINCNFYSMLRSFLALIDIENAGFVIYQNKLKDFERCTDFTRLEFSRSQNALIESEFCYYHPNYEFFITLKPDLSSNDDDDDDELFEQGVFGVKEIFYDQSKANVKQDMEKFFDTYIQKYVSNQAKISILVKTKEGFELKSHKIKPYTLDVETMYNDDFLPVHHHIKESLSQTNKGVVLLHGLAGTGKTNYIKWLTSQIPEKKFIFVPTNIIHQLTDPTFFSLLIENKNSVLVLEDCENYIAERSFNNPHTDVVASILNLADGMLSDIAECQMICTFNASIDKIDTALLRAGRLIAEYRFKELSVEKANQYLQSVDMDKTVDKAMTLAELTNLEKQLFKEKEVDKPKFGFI